MTETHGTPTTSELEKTEEDLASNAPRKPAKADRDPAEGGEETVDEALASQVAVKQDEPKAA